ATGRAVVPGRAVPLGAAAACRQAYREGRRLTDNVLAICARRNGLPVTRIGISGRRAMGTAVRRNRVRRRVREAIRLEQQQMGGFGFVIVPRLPAAAAPFGGLRAAVHGLLQQAGVLRPRHYPADASNPADAAPTHAEVVEVDEGHAGPRAPDGCAA